MTFLSHRDTATAIRTLNRRAMDHDAVCEAAAQRIVQLEETLNTARSVILSFRAEVKGSKEIYRLVCLRLKAMERAFKTIRDNTDSGTFDTDREEMELLIEEVNDMARDMVGDES